MNNLATSVNEHVENLLGGNDCISTEEITISGNYDYTMLIQVMASYNSQTSPYRIKLMGGYSKLNGYKFPKMLISRR